jgi:hypothetical protein
MGKKAVVVGWRNRIVRLEYHKPDDLLDHPKQWKRHGDRQLAALRRDRRWRQVSARLYGDDKSKSQRSIRRTGSKKFGAGKPGYGGHFRAVQGFRYVGEPRGA